MEEKVKALIEKWKEELSQLKAEMESPMSTGFITTRTRILLTARHMLELKRLLEE